MDGVIYRGGTPIPGAVDFINGLVQRGIPFRFLTNNSQRTRRDVTTHLRRLGFKIEPTHIYTCAMATARYLASQKSEGTVFVIGEGGLLTALNRHGFSMVEKDADYVVLGEGRTFNAESMETALNLIINGARLIATNLDPNCPTSTGWRPGCGALVAMLEAASGVKAFSVGKPSPIMMRGGRKEMGLAASETIMIGDTMSTDILGGLQLGYFTTLVLSGTTSREDLRSFSYQPDLVANSIQDLNHDLLVEHLASRNEIAYSLQPAA